MRDRCSHIITRGLRFKCKTSYLNPQQGAGASRKNVPSLYPLPGTEKDELQWLPHGSIRKDIVSLDFQQGGSTRPEFQTSAQEYYNEEVAEAYTNNSRMMTVQRILSRRALQLLSLDKRGQHLLDIGCGSGVTSETVCESGHCCTGVDISISMMHAAKIRDKSVHLVKLDMRQGLPFRDSSFDAIISVSAMGWLFNLTNYNQTQSIVLETFMDGMYECLRPGGRAVLQFYFNSLTEVELFFEEAGKRFSGGLIVDPPTSVMGAKLYLCLKKLQKNVR